MDLQLSQQLTVIVGAAQGIGKAIAEAFATEGARLALLDLDEAVHNVAEEIQLQHNVPAQAIKLDATDYDAVKQAVDQIAQALGCHQHLVYTAGVGSGKYGFPFWNLEPGDWEQVWKVNLLGAVHVAHAFAPAMVEAKQGTILFLSSIAGQIGSQSDPPYSAAKAATINFTQCAAKDLAPYNVRVNAISPGMIKTKLNRSVWQAWNAQQTSQGQIEYETWAEEKIRRVAPLGRWQTPQDIAALALFLASSQAKNITGQTLNVDGGQVMHG